MLEMLIERHLNRKNILFLTAVAVALILVIKMQDIAVMFFASYVIACSLNPVVDKLENKFSRHTASFVVLFFAIFIFAIFFIPLFVLAGHEVKQFLIMFSSYADNIKEFVSNSLFLKQPDITSTRLENALSSASSFTTNVIQQIIDFGRNISSAFVYFIASLMIIYYFMADKTNIKNAYLHLFPKQMRKKAGEVSDMISDKVGGYIVGQIAAMSCVGVIMTVGLLFLNVDYAFLLGFITAILDIIPIVGLAIALIICLAAAYKCGFIILILIVIVFAIAQLVENNFVRPYVFGKLLDIHPILIYLFLFITAKYMGVIGVVFAPAIAATICVLVQELYVKNLE